MFFFALARLWAFCWHIWNVDDDNDNDDNDAAAAAVLLCAMIRCGIHVTHICVFMCGEMCVTCPNAGNCYAAPEIKPQ